MLHVSQEFATLTWRSSHLADFDLRGCRSLSDDSCSQLALLSQLRRLDIGGCRLLTDAGVAKLARLSLLRYIGLARTAVTSQGLRALAPLTELRFVANSLQPLGPSIPASVCFACVGVRWGFDPPLQRALPCYVSHLPVCTAFCQGYNSCAVQARR